MWWLDDSDTAAAPSREPESDREQFDTAHTLEVAALRRQTESLQSELQELQESLTEADTARRDLEAAREQGALAHAADLAANTQARQEAETALRASETLRVNEADSLRAEIQTLEQSLAESQAAVAELQTEAAERDTAHVAQVAASEEARACAELRADEVTARLKSLEEESETLHARLDTENRQRSAAESELQDCRRELSFETSRLESKIHALERAAEENAASRAEQFDRAAHALHAAESRVREVEGDLHSLAEETSSLELRLEGEIQGRQAAQRELDRCRADHATQLASLSKQIQTLQGALDRSQTLGIETVAAAEQREADGARVLIETEKAREAAEARASELADRVAAMDVELAGRRDVEQQHASQNEFLQSQLRDLEERARQHEAKRRESELASTQASERHAAELLKANDAREAAEMRGAELVAQRQSLQREVESSLAQADMEIASRVSAEKELHKANVESGRLRGEAERARSDYETEKQLRSLSQTQVTDLRAELARRRNELDQVRESAVSVMKTQRAAQQEIEELVERFLALKHKLDATRSTAARRDTRSTSELKEMRATLRQQAAELTACRDHIRQIEAELQAAVQRHEDEQGNRRRAEALANRLSQSVDVLRQKVEDFRGLAQREAAARKKLEKVMQRAGDGPDNDASLRAAYASIKVNQRIRRLMTELTAMRNQELSVRRRAAEEIKRAQEQVQKLQDELSEKRAAA